MTMAFSKQFYYVARVYTCVHVWFYLFFVEGIKEKQKSQVHCRPAKKSSRLVSSMACLKDVAIKIALCSHKVLCSLLF